MRHIAGRDAAFGRFLLAPAEARIGSEAFDTSVYITGETQSGKSYLSQLLAWCLSGLEKSSVWILDPHGPLARACAEWSKLRHLPNTYYFDVGLAGAGTDPLRPRFNPFDQLPDKSPATLDIVTLPSPDKAEPKHPDGEPVPAAELAPEVFQSGRKRPKYPS